MSTQKYSVFVYKTNMFRISECFQSFPRWGTLLTGGGGGGGGQYSLVKNVWGDTIPWRIVSGGTVPFLHRKSVDSLIHDTIPWRIVSGGTVFTPTPCHFYIESLPTL